MVHSFHCFFVLAGDSNTPVLYHVERVREGRSFATRTVQARQRGRPIFTVTCSFVREGSGGEKTISHAAGMPEGAGPPPPDDYEDEHPRWNGEDEHTVKGEKKQNGGKGKESEDLPSPFQSHRIRIEGDRDAPPEHKKARQWVRARGRISEEGGHQAHLSALAYISDSYFIGSVTRFHRLWRFPVSVDDVDRLPDDAREYLVRLNEWEGNGSIEDFKGQPEIGMLVSLDQYVFFFLLLLFYSLFAFWPLLSVVLSMVFHFVGELSVWSLLLPDRNA